MKLAGILVGVMLIAVGVVGCGGDGGDETTVVKADFVKQANAVCLKAAKKRDATAQAAFRAQEKLPQAESESEIEKSEWVLARVIRPLAEMSDELAALSVPGESADEAEAVSAAFQEAIDEVEAEPTQVVKGEVNPFGKPKKLAGEYGIKACATI